MARRPEVALDVCEVGLRQAGASAALLCAKARLLQSLSRVGEAARRLSRGAGRRSGERRRRGTAWRCRRLRLATGMGPRALIAPLPRRRRRLDWLAARIALGPRRLRRPRAERAARAGRGRDAAPDQQRRDGAAAGRGAGRAGAARRGVRRVQRAARRACALLRRARGGPRERDREAAAARGLVRRRRSRAVAARAAGGRRSAGVRAPCLPARASRARARRCWSRRWPDTRSSSRSKRRRRWPRPMTRFLADAGGSGAAGAADRRRGRRTGAAVYWREVAAHGADAARHGVPRQGAGGHALPAADRQAVPRGEAAVRDPRSARRRAELLPAAASR